GTERDRRVVAHVVGDIEVEPAVSVQVRVGAAAPPLTGTVEEPCREGNVTEPPPSARTGLIMKQRIPPETRHEEVHVTVIVVVAGTAAHGVGVDRDARHRGNVREAAVALVVEEPAAGPLAVPAEILSAADEEQIRA